MRVLHVTPYFAPAFNYGGPPRSILGLCRALLKVGVNLDVFTTTANGAIDLPATLGKTGEYEGVPVRYFPRTFPRKFFGAAGLAKMIPSVLDRYDLVHIHGLWNLPVWAASRPARKAGLPYVISPRGMLEPASMSHKSLRKRLAYLITERRNLSNARLLHATSAIEGQTLKSYGFDADIVVLPNGVDVWEGSSPLQGTFRRSHGLDENAKLVVYLGRIHPIKRLDILASAFGRISKDIPHSQLVIAGPDEAGHRRSLEPIFSQIGDRALWLGELGQADKWALLRDANVLVMCSDSESFGISVVEAMAAGLPVVVTKTCPWQEVETAGCGLWVDQESGEIAKALNYILSHPVEAEAMGARGKALAFANYNWDSIARKMAAYYATVANSGLSVG